MTGVQTCALPISLPKFSGRALSQPLECWTYGCPSGEMKKIQGGVDAVAKLRLHGLSSQGLVAAYLKRGVVPLMRRSLGLWQMVPDKAPWEGTATTPPMTEDEVQAHIRRIMGPGVPYPPDVVVDPLPCVATRELVSPLCLLRRAALPSSFDVS